jgi:hypothetical protein
MKRHPATKLEYFIISLPFPWFSLAAFSDSLGGLVADECLNVAKCLLGD